MDYFLGWNKSWQPLVRIVPAYVNTITNRTILISRKFKMMSLMIATEL